MLYIEHPCNRRDETGQVLVAHFSAPDCMRSGQRRVDQNRAVVIALSKVWRHREAASPAFWRYTEEDRLSLAAVARCRPLHGVSQYIVLPTSTHICS